MFEPCRWTPAQLEALVDLVELHPGEPMGTDSFANPGSNGMVRIDVDEEIYVIHEDGRVIDSAGVEIGAEVVA